MADISARTRHVLSRSVSLRVRITAVAVLTVGLTLAAGSVLLVALLHGHLVEGSRVGAQTLADTVSSTLASGADSDRPVSLRSGDDDEDEFVQILDGEGRVLAATRSAADLPAVTVADKDEVVTVEVDGDPFVVAATEVTTPRGPRTVLAGKSLESANDATSSLTGLLLAGVPAVTAVVAAMTWVLVGRTLAPVDRIRREVEEISAAQLHRRLPEPAQEDEIGRLARTMNRMLARLEQAQRRQRRFVSDAAHELRSPVASIKQNLEVATTYPEHLSTEELLETVRAETTRLERLVGALLSLARLDEGAPPSAGVSVDLDDLVFAEAHRLRHTTSLRIDTTAVSAARVSGDAALLGQALRNLTDNAQRHARSSIAFTLAEHDTTVTLSVQDDGPGIPSQDRERVFERFVRLDEARTRDDGGSGLGLAIVHDVVTTHHGAVSAELSPLGGAQLLLTLPRQREAPSQRRVPPSREDPPRTDR